VLINLKKYILYVYMSEAESDSSIEPQDEAPVVIEKVKKQKKITLDNPKKKKTKMIEVEISDSEPDEPVKLEKPKKKMGRPPQSKEEKLAKKTIIKEKIIYMIPSENGEYKKVKNPELTQRDLKKIKLQKEKEEQEKILGKTLIQKKNGTIDKRSIGMKTRSLAQQNATEAMLLANKKRREAQKELKMKEKKEIVKDSVREVVNEPFYTPKEPPPPKYIF